MRNSLCLHSVLLHLFSNSRRLAQLLEMATVNEKDRMNTFILRLQILGTLSAIEES